MYKLTVEDTFASAHQLRGYKGKCENIHGHNWKIELTVKGDSLNNIGLLIDFHELKDILKNVLDTLDHKNINEIPPFTGINPSSENLARYICEEVTHVLSKKNPDIFVHAVTVWESEKSRCTYEP